MSLRDRSLDIGTPHLESPDNDWTTAIFGDLATGPWIARGEAWAWQPSLAVAGSVSSGVVSTVSELPEGDSGRVYRKAASLPYGYLKSG